MYRERSIAVIIPAYNESKNIDSVLSNLPALVDSVLVVDDKSTDTTCDVVRAAGDGRVTLICRDKNGGVGAAMRTGYEAALEQGADIVVKMDGDGQMNPEDISALCDPIIDGACEYAKGNRFLGRGHVKAMPFSRLAGNVALTFLTKLASGYWNVFDPQNGYTAISRKSLVELELSRVADDYFFENSMLVLLNLQEARVKDVSIPSLYADEESGVSVPRAVLTFPPRLLRGFAVRIWQRYVVRDFSPVALFLLFGTILFTWGFVFGLYHWIMSIRLNHTASTGTVMLAVLPLLMGFELLLQAIVLDINQTPK